MAFDKTGLNVAASSKSGNAPQIFTYSTGDDLNDVDTAGYFDNGNTTNTGMRDIMNVGDFIMVYAANGYGITVVNANSSGIIDTNDITAISGDNR